MWTQLCTTTLVLAVTLVAGQSTEPLPQGNLRGSGVSVDLVTAEELASSNVDTMPESEVDGFVPDQDEEEPLDEEHLMSLFRIPDSEDWEDGYDFPSMEDDMAEQMRLLESADPNQGIHVKRDLETGKIYLIDGDVREEFDEADFGEHGLDSLEDYLDLEEDEDENMEEWDGENSLRRLKKDKKGGGGKNNNGGGGGGGGGDKNNNGGGGGGGDKNNNNNGRVTPANMVTTSHAVNMLRLLNRTRENKGMQPLSFSLDIQEEAQRWARLMATRDRYEHRRPIGQNINKWRELGENIAWRQSVESAHKGLMNSPSHRANILYRPFNYVGIGVYRHTDGFLWICQIFKKW